MGKVYDHIPADLITWALQQHVFWVATAPLSANGHVNLSPKGVSGTFHVVNQNKVWYEDLTGSGVETISHLRENKRITIMFNAFEGGPRILRLFGTGTVHEFGTTEYEALLPQDQRNPGSRAVIVVDVDRVGSSCGYAVPFYTYAGPRDTLANWVMKLEHKDREQADREPGTTGPGGLVAYWKKTNLKSIDGIPGLESAPASGVTPLSFEKEKEILARAGNRKAQPTADQVVRVAESRGAGEHVRLLLAFVVGIVVATFYGEFSVLAGESLGKLGLLSV
ncbi:hypothetical protein FA95DRAFT_1564788 [Auriscalpium vulgare]|uniref:Uncharacterized protein n=1 Tax=Auriscalpium vulgare TaxID=40419 RepID=A0ACB8RD72_9AGAM|nr:hypothetical protein FA95DRAFT_1564788 [Auriscalpium vulgare]